MASHSQRHCLPQESIEALARLGSLAPESSDALKHIATCKRCKALLSAAAGASSVPPIDSPPRVAEAQTQDTFGPYRLIQKVGSGGMGDVFMAEQLEPFRRIVALKAIKRGMDTERIVARFESER